MAIKFARVEFVKRSAGKNACAKAAYISRSKVEFYGNNVSKPNTYDWSYMGAVTFHEVLLPANVDEKFKDLTVLWNAAESKEVRSNAQVAMELVLALPDEKIISVEDRIELTKTFVQEHFVNKGLAAEIAIHPPEKRFYVTGNNKDLGLKKGMTGHVVSKNDEEITVKFETGQIITFNPKEFTGFIEKEHNWHAHVLFPTRRFKDEGLELEDKKARDMMPRVNLGRVTSGPDWGKLWAEHQNQYFQDRGLALQVDIQGIVPQEHLGPYRMRARAFSLFEEHSNRIEKNQEAATKCDQILEALTSNQSVFTKADLARFLDKHAPTEAIEAVVKEFWSLPQLIQLVDKQTGKLLPKYTSQAVIEEEQQILRLSDRLVSKDALAVRPKNQQPPKELSSEQLEAYKHVIQGKRLSLLQGYAGTGKSYVLKALQETYQKEGYRVRAFGPDSSTADVLKDKGLTHTENVYRFLFALHHERREIRNGKEIWILDEAGKLGNRPLLEFLKEADKRKVQIILAGDSAQMPSVERGGMFKALCQRNGAKHLEDIQRQKRTDQREITHNLAKGNYSSAIDKISQAKGLIWADNKEQAMENLVKRWAQDTKSYKSGSTLIVAHSNAEVRVLNEMVRLIRRQRGELGKKEFECTTSTDKLFLSVGDRIEFRRNDPSLGVTNGLSGVLIEAEANRFVVSVNGTGKKKETVVFNPQEYHAYQLGYASTYYRSQGRTIDRAYVLHSPMLNKQMFYVGLTRHVKDVSYFLSKDEVYCLSDLKRLSTRSADKALSVEFTTQSIIENQKEIEQKQHQINQLINSESVVNRMKGYGLAVWDKVVTKTMDINDRVQDRRPNEAFYNPVLPKEASANYSVFEVPETISTETQEPDTSVSSSEYEIRDKERPMESKILSKLSPEREPQVKEYTDKSEAASALKTMVDAEVETSGKDIRLTSYFRQWQETCGARNQVAYHLLQSLSNEEKQNIPSKTLKVLQEQSSRYEAFLAKNDRSTKLSLEDRLKENLDSLLYRLYPDGPTGRNRTSFRFGSKGSLSVAHSGPKAGQFYDFEQQVGGGLLKLIQREMGLGQGEARTWAQHFLSEPSDVSIPSFFKRSMKESKAEDVWVSCKPAPEEPAPSLDAIKGKKLASYFDEVSRHAYRDADGKLLYYVLRLHDKHDPKKKVTPPLSYGYWRSQPEQKMWELKGYKTDANHLYNLHLLKQHPKAQVLIVEGEKTADQALSKLSEDDYICITWPGGAGAVARADWSPLVGRKVLIWPDNDQAGYAAGEKVCQELRKVGVESLHLVNTADLKKYFPEKWDLADKLPDGVSEQFPKKLLAQAVQRGINPEQVMVGLALNPKDPVQRSRVNEILWRVEDRERAELEFKHPNQPWKVQEEIIKETQRHFVNQEKQKTTFKDEFAGNTKALEAFTYQVCLAQAKQGRDIRLNEMQLIKETIQQQGYLNIPKSLTRDAAQIHEDRILTKACERAYEGLSSKEITKYKQTESQQFEPIERQTQQMKELENRKQLEALKQTDLGIKL